MSDYFEYSKEHPSHDSAPSSFVRPLNLSDPNRRRSTATSRHSHGSGLTYVTIPPGGEHGPPEPIFGMPTPVIPGHSALLEEEDPSRSTDYMMVNADPEYNADMESGVQIQGGRKGFVGGFVSGLRRLPKVMLRHPKGVDGAGRKEHLMRATVGTEGADLHTGDILPRYQSHSDQPPLNPVNVEIVEGMDMPNQHTVSVTIPSLRDSREHDQTSPEFSDRHQSRPNTTIGDTTLIHQSQINIGTPIDREPLPGSDYDKMSSVLQHTEGASIASHINRLQRFFHDINELPWVSSRVAVDYIPEKNGRRGTGKHKTPKVTETWYPTPINDLDLMSNGTTDMSDSTPVMARRRNGHRRALTDSTTPPSSAGLSRTLDSPSTNITSPRYSVTSEPGPGGRNLRHIRNSRHHQRRPHYNQPQQAQQAMYIAAPQPLYLYGPPTPPSLQQPVTGSPGQNQPMAASPGLPVYMISMPPPVYQPMSSFPYPVGQPQPSSPPARS